MEGQFVGYNALHESMLRADFLFQGPMILSADIFVAQCTAFHAWNAIVQAAVPHQGCDVFVNALKRIFTSHAIHFPDVGAARADLAVIEGNAVEVAARKTLLKETHFTLLTLVTAAVRPTGAAQAVAPVAVPAAESSVVDPGVDFLRAIADHVMSMYTDTSLFAPANDAPSQRFLVGSFIARLLTRDSAVSWEADERTNGVEMLASAARSAFPSYISHSQAAAGTAILSGLPHRLMVDAPTRYELNMFLSFLTVIAWSSTRIRRQPYSLANDLPLSLALHIVLEDMNLQNSKRVVTTKALQSITLSDPLWTKIQHCRHDAFPRSGAIWQHKKEVLQKAEIAQLTKADGAPAQQRPRFENPPQYKNGPRVTSVHVKPPQRTPFRKNLGGGAQLAPRPPRQIENVTCFVCQGKGHYSGDCPTKKVKTEPQN